MLEKALTGSNRYWGWIAVLLAFMAAGALSYVQQYNYGLGLTGMSRDVSWGVYIAQFTFLVGVAASGVMVVLPYYLHNYKTFGKITILGEFLAVASVSMCLLFILADLGQPLRAHYHEGDHEDEDELRRSDVEHVWKGLRPAPILPSGTESRCPVAGPGALGGDLLDDRRELVLHASGRTSEHEEMPDQRDQERDDRDRRHDADHEPDEEPGTHGGDATRGRGTPRIPWSVALRAVQAPPPLEARNSSM